MPKKKKSLPVKEKDLGGRPTLYKPEYCKMLIDHFNTGLSFESFAGVVGVARSTVYEWKGNFPEFKEATEVGQAKGLLFFEKVGIRIMMDQLADSNGNKVKGNIAAWFIQMKNRYGYSDNPSASPNEVVKFENIPALLNALKGEDENEHAI